MTDKLNYAFRYSEDAFKDDGSISDSLLSEIISLPAFSDASAEDLRVLLCLLKYGCDADKEALADAAFCSEEELKDALQFWRGAGLLRASSKRTGKKSSEKEESERSKQTKRAIKSEDKIYATPSDELAKVIDKKKLKSLIDACQQTVGKIMSTAEINIVVGLYEQLSLDGEYILMLISYCYEQNKRSMKYVEKVAFSLCEMGILTSSALEIYLEERRKFASFEWQLKKMFGIGERDFTKKQQEFVLKWETEYKYGIEILGLAYDITVDNIGKVDFRYIDKILHTWHENGLKKEKEILAFEEQEKKNRSLEKEKESKKSSQGKTSAQSKNSVGFNSFDVDDFFSKAVERSYKKK